MPQRTWTAIPAKRSPMSDANLRAKVLFAGLAVCGVIGLIAGFAWLSAASKPAPSYYTAPSGQGVAEVAVRQWLSGNTPNIPSVVDDGLATPTTPSGGYTLAWDGYTPTTFARADGRVVDLELHRFLYASDDGALFIITATVETGTGAPGSSPVLVGLPSIEALPVPDDVPSVRYGGYVEYTPTDADNDAIHTWAQAYATNDTLALGQVAGNVARTYVGLGGFELYGDTPTSPAVKVISAVRPNPASQTVVVRISVRMRRTADGFTATVPYELILDISGPVPRIPLWGPYGSGQDLYTNS